MGVDRVVSHPIGHAHSGLWTTVWPWSLVRTQLIWALVTYLICQEGTIVITFRTVMRLRNMYIKADGKIMTVQLSSVQLLSRVWLFETPWTAARQIALSITNSLSLLKLMSIESVISSNHLILCRPLLLPPSIFPSNKVFLNESVLRIRWAKYWSFSFRISPSNEQWGLISFRIDWLDLLTVLGTLKSLLQHHNSKSSILLCSYFFIVQFSHPYITTRKTIALTRQTFVGKVMSLLFNMLSTLVITFLSRSKHL